VAALAAIINGVMVLAAGPEILIDIAAKIAGVSADELKATLGPEGVEALTSSSEVGFGYDILKNRAMVTLVGGVLLLVFALLMHKAAMWARILVTLSALIAAGMSLLTATKTDEGTGMMIALAWITVLVGVVAIVLTWLPANSRFAKSAR
jgi:hypothetical protein